MRELARLVSACKAFASQLEDVGPRLPAEEESPFLRRQLERSLVQLWRSVEDHLPEVAARIVAGLEKDGAGLMDRVRRTFARRRGGDRPDVQADIESSLEEGLQGNTWTVPIPDLLGFLATGRKTGVLWVHDVEETYLLQLDAGALVHATSDGNPDRMRVGEVLVHLGKITSEEIDEFVQTLGEEAGFLGSELVEAKKITEGDLTDALAFQIQEMFRRLLESRSSVFRFQEGMRLMSRADVHINVQGLLLEVMRQADELSNALCVLDGDEPLGDATPIEIELED